MISCGNDATKSADNSDVVMVEEDTEIDKLSNAEDIDFDAALTAYENKNYAKASKYLDNTVADLKEASKSGITSSPELMNMSIAAMEKLSKMVKAGKINDQATLEQTFAEADMLIAHNYLVLSDLYLVDEPQKSKGMMEKAADKIEGAENSLEGAAKETAITMKKDIRKVVKKGDMEADKIKSKVKGMSDFLSTLKLVDHLPGYNPDI